MKIVKMILTCEECIATETGFMIEFESTDLEIYLCDSCFNKLQTLEKPKKMVKKWQWLGMSIKYRNLVITQLHYATKEDVEHFEFSNLFFDVLYKIPESEIEIEE